MFDFLKSLLPKTPVSASAKTGAIGENAAVKFLKNTRKMKIVARNFRHLHTEIDIIARDADAMVFIEVKTRSADALVDGYYAAVSKKKRDAVRRCAFAYMKNLNPRPHTWRFDVVDVRIAPNFKVKDVRHFENIPY